MASVTRSSRRAEGHHHSTSAMRSRPANFKHAVAEGGEGGGGGGGGGGEVGQGGRTKRALDVPNDYEPVKSKKARIAVDFLSPPQTQAGTKNQNKAGNTTSTTNKSKAASAQGKAVAPAADDATAAPRKGGGTAAITNNTETTTSKPPNSGETDPNLTKHQAKVINGIKHELDRLQPEGSVGKEPGRKLRSQEATRFKSELSAYFPDYDEVIGNEPKEEHLLNIDTPILVQDSGVRRGAEPGSQRKAAKTNHQPTTAGFGVRGYGDALYTDVVDAQRIDFSFLETQFKNKTLEDPLPDSLFEPVHKRAERLERSIRNTEKGRAQHEKDQIIRLLEGLQGHDWLRILGVSGITESRKKGFEPARQHYIKGCQAIIDKFKSWSLEEKRRKLEKEQALAEKAEDDDSEASAEADEEEEEAEAEEETSQGADASSTGDTSEASSPAKQLREEAMARSKLSAKTAKKPRATARPEVFRPPPPPQPPKEFKSFFSKRYERDSAVNRTRRTGRKVLAWGLPVPDFPEADFDLPESYRDEETMRLRARKKRRDRRGSRM